MFPPVCRQPVPAKLSSLKHINLHFDVGLVIVQSQLVFSLNLKGKYKNTVISRWVYEKIEGTFKEFYDNVN